MIFMAIKTKSRQGKARSGVAAELEEMEERLSTCDSLMLFLNGESIKKRLGEMISTSVVNNDADGLRAILEFAGRRSDIAEVLGMGSGHGKTALQIAAEWGASEEIIRILEQSCAKHVKTEGDGAERRGDAMESDDRDDG